MIKVTFETKDIKELKILLEELHKKKIEFYSYNVNSDLKQDLLLDLLDLSLWKSTSKLKEEYGKYQFVSIRTINRLLNRLYLKGRVDKKRSSNPDGSGRWLEWRLK
jgi:hypothetical protein